MGSARGLLEDSGALRYLRRRSALGKRELRLLVRSLQMLGQISHTQPSRLDDVKKLGHVIFRRAVRRALSCDGILIFNHVAVRAFLLHEIGLLYTLILRDNAALWAVGRHALLRTPLPEHQAPIHPGPKRRLHELPGFAAGWSLAPLHPHQHRNGSVARSEPDCGFPLRQLLLHIQLSLQLQQALIYACDSRACRAVEVRRCGGSRFQREPPGSLCPQPVGLRVHPPYALSLLQFSLAERRTACHLRNFRSCEGVLERQAVRGLALLKVVPSFCKRHEV
mmetsp:Transcript_6600/g.25472  ORF Transcript_6600/g.25472 Transcript_6600/m.25472 type:complete len:279 (-) Transcript_6600:976-1812(-)|eukprot:scaffold48_cov311-Pinguiococcus_pyrenoidosus.AAC.269